MTDKTGGPAFPFVAEDDTGTMINMGMSMRDYFAAKGLEALMVNVTSELQSKHFSIEKSLEIKRLYAEMCYAMADAMLKAREQ